MTPDGHRCNILKCRMLAESCFLEESMRKQVYLFSAGFLTALTPIFVALSWYAPTVHTLHIAMLIYVLLPLNVLWTWRSRDYLAGLGWLHATNFCIILLAAIAYPGIGTPQMWWLAAIPFVCLLSRLQRVGLSLQAVVVVYVGWVYVRSGTQEGVDAGVSARSYAAVVLSNLYVCGHLVFSMRWRDKLQTALEAAHLRAAASSAAKARFLASISHEIRTPLNGVIGAAELLRRPDIQDGQRQQLAALQEQSAKTLLALINDILDWSKLDVGKMVLDLQPVYLRSLVFEVNELFAIAAFERNIELTSSCDVDVPRLFKADSTRIRQILTNLVGNAVKFTHEGGVHIHVSLESGDSGVRMADRTTVRIDISDSGIGIPETEVSQLFEAFHQADPSVTRRFGGTGLGLAICKELVRLMNGEITVRSAPGAGSTFSVILPLLPCRNTAPTTQTPPTSAGRVLLATSSWRLESHVAPLLKELRVSHETLAELPDPLELPAFSHLLLDASLVDSTADLRTWIEGASKSLRVALLVPFGADAIRGIVPNATLVYKPVRRSALSAFFEVETKSQAASDIAEDLTRQSVLVCEDNSVNQIIVQAMLAELGASSVLARDGVEALERLASQEFDLVLMDLQMPRLDGPGATRQWRRLESSTGDRVPIIAMTANSDGDDYLLCREAGMDDLLAKPFGISSLQRCLQKWAPGSAARTLMSAVLEASPADEAQP